MAFEPLQGLATICNLVTRVAFGADHLGKGLARVRMIVDDENAAHGTDGVSRARGVGTVHFGMGGVSVDSDESPNEPVFAVISAVEPLGLKAEGEELIFAFVRGQL